MVDHRILIIDVEATCWRRSPPPGEVQEIIEIGLCWLDLTAPTPSDRRSILVRPERSKVSHYCTKLTTLTQAQVDEGIRFAEACTILEQEHNSQQVIWASWGNYDRRMFAEQCAATSVRYPFGEQHINIKSLYADQMKLTSPVGLARAMKMLDMPMQGTHHRGDDDAWNIAHVLAHFVRKHGPQILDD